MPERRMTVKQRFKRISAALMAAILFSYSTISAAAAPIEPEKLVPLLTYQTMLDFRTLEYSEKKLTDRNIETIEPNQTQKINPGSGNTRIKQAEIIMDVENYGNKDPISVYYTTYLETSNIMYGDLRTKMETNADLTKNDFDFTTTTEEVKKAENNSKTAKSETWLIKNKLTPKNKNLKMRWNTKYIMTSNVAGNTASIYIPSITIIASSPEEITELEKITNMLIEQNKILKEYFPNIIAMLDTINKNVGNITTAQDLTNTYLQQIKRLIEASQNNTTIIIQEFHTTQNIIKTESGNIQAAIKKQTEDLKKYLDDSYSGAIGNLPQANQELEQKVEELHNTESKYEQDMQNNFNALQMDSFQFSGNLIPALTICGNIINNVWSTMDDDMHTMYTFPLLLAIALLIIGKIARSSRKKGGDE